MMIHFSEEIYTLHSPLLHTVHSSYGSAGLEHKKNWVTVEKWSYICNPLKTKETGNFKTFTVFKDWKIRNIKT